ELEESLTEATTNAKLNEDKVRSLEEHIIDLHEKLEEDAHELGDLAVVKRKLQDEIEAMHERNRKDLEEREAVVDHTRKKYQKELKQLMTELEIEKGNSVNLKTSNKDLEAEVEGLSNRLEAELRGATIWK